MEEEEYMQDPVYEEDNAEMSGSAQLQFQVPMNLGPSKSSTYPYTLYEMDSLVKKIEKEIEEMAGMLGISREWCLQLYFQCGWAKDHCYKLLDENQSFKKVINYIPQTFKQVDDQNMCQVCFSSTHLLQNPCSHRFCKYCWESILMEKLKTFQLFPSCIEDGCNFKMHLSLINHLTSINNSLANRFKQVMCKSYAKLNRAVKLCPSPSCEKVFIINSFEEDTLQCSCGQKACVYCGEQLHKPADCSDAKNWKKIISDSQNKWIEIVQYKLCPHCKQPIEKNQGCIHMTCRCKGEFCWICGAIWSAHATGYNCPQKEEFQRLEQMRKRKLQDEKGYREKFQNAKAIYETCKARTAALNSIDIEAMRTQLFNNLHILNTNSYFLRDLLEFLLMEVSYYEWGHITIFFASNEQDLVKFELSMIEKKASLVDTFIRDFVPDLIKKHQLSKITQQQAENQFQTQKVKIMQVKAEGINYLRKLLKTVL